MIHISGVLVRCRPENIDAVTQTLTALEGVEVHAANPDGRLVVTVEADGDQAIADRVVQLQDQPQVIAASMIYHQFEDAAGDESPASSGDARPATLPADIVVSQNSISQEAQS